MWGRGEPVDKLLEEELFLQGALLQGGEQGSLDVWELEAIRCLQREKRCLGFLEVVPPLQGVVFGWPSVRGGEFGASGGRGQEKGQNQCPQD